MSSKLENVFKKYGNGRSVEHTAKYFMKPRQTSYVSLLHNFSGSKTFKINLEDYRDDHRLIHYGNNVFGLYEAPGYQTFDRIYTLNTNADAQLDGFYTKEPTELEIKAGILLSDPTLGVRRLPKFLVKYNEEVYKADKEQHRNYWNWKANRNEKRSTLEEEFGYDTKHAMHLVRLLRMAEEILTDGVVTVHRPDAQELLAIRNGAWSYEELLAYSEGKDEHIRTTLYNTSSLPKTPNIKLASTVLMECQDMMWKPQDPRLLVVPESAKCTGVTGLCPPTIL